MKRALPLVFIIISAFLITGTSYAAEVNFFTPQDAVKGVRQVTARFSEPMVPFGDPRLVEPFIITCPARGRQRWVDDKNWVYDFERNLPAGVMCQFMLKADLRTLAGDILSGQQKFSFTTGGPTIIGTNPREGWNIDEAQAFILALDAEVKENTVLEHAYCSIEGIKEQVGVRIIKGSDRERIIKSQGQYYNFGLSQDKSQEYSIIILQCRQRFPSSSSVQLVWGKGIESLSGVTTANAQILPYKVRSPFQATFSCDRESENAGCIPFLPLYLQFSTPVAREYAQAVFVKGPKDVKYKPVLQQTDDNEAGDESKQPEFVQAVRFIGPFPPRTALILNLPKDIRDDAGRELSNSEKFPLVINTADYPPLAKFAAQFGIIERSDPVLPVTVRNIEAEVKAKIFTVMDNTKVVGGKISGDEAGERQDLISGQIIGKVKSFATEADVIIWLDRVSEADPKKSIFSGTHEERTAHDFSLPKPNGPKAFEVVGIPLKGAGFYVVELNSMILGESLHGEPKSYFVPTAALVTNLSAHFKQGRESSVVWVTTLDKAEPVKDASISIRDCHGTVHWEGMTDAGGIAFVNKQLLPEDKLPQCNHESMRGYYVFARKTDDMTFVRSVWNQGIETWRFNLPLIQDHRALIAHTVLDRNLLRAGETVSMKHLIRKHTTAGFSFIKDLPKTVVIQHKGSDQRYEFNLSWHRGGIAETTWKIPKDAKLGTYTITMHREQKSKVKQTAASGGDNESEEEYINTDSLPSGSFRIEEFRVPLMKGIIQPPKEPLVNKREVTVDLFVQYLAGGGASGATVKLRTLIAPHHVIFATYDDFLFANGRVKEGIISRGEQTYYYDEASGESEDGETNLTKARTRELTLDMTGSIRTTIEGLQKSNVPQNIQAEMEYQDPNGEVQTVSSRIPLWPSGVIIGIKQDSWLASKDSFKFQVLVLDLFGKPMPNQSVTAELLLRKNYSHRKRLIGGFYAYEHTVETKKVGQVCAGQTDTQGLLFCEATSPVSGNVIIQARTVDSVGNESVANRDLWIADKSEWWFDISDNDRMDILPEQKHYEPGEVARFQVRMPFREATALVSVEREGVMEMFVKKLSGKMPVIEIPVRGNYAPNVFVSVLCVRGRVGDIKPTALVDLGKPAYKLGITEVYVGWRAHELQVFLTPEKHTYQVREQAKVHIQVRQRDKSKSLPPKGTELAIVAVDEGLLELMPNKSWKLLDAMMGRRGYEVQTATAHMQVVGKRHYGLKSYPAGGGGGHSVTREMFNTLLLWKGRVKLNENGETSIAIPLNDSLTSFRIAAIANADVGLFGSGETSIRTTQDLMLLSGMPSTLREGDNFQAGLTVRNASNRKMEVEISAEVNNASVTPNIRLVSIVPGEAKEIFWDVTTPQNADSLVWKVSAKERNGSARDNLKIIQAIVEARQTRVFQATISQIEQTLTESIQKPKDALPGKGGVNVLLDRTLSNGLSGVTLYMKNYPYSCMEQKTSRAVALRDKSLWKAVVAELPSYLDSDGLVKYFPTCSEGSDALTAYILSVSNEARWDLPTDLKEHMLVGLRKFIEGKVIRWSALPTADSSIRKIAALEALSRFNNIEPKMLGSITLEPNLWPTSAVIDWANILMRSPNLPKQEERLKVAEQVIRSRLSFQGTTMDFSTEKSDNLFWLMISGDLNAAKTVLTFVDHDRWKEDMPRLIRGVMGRQRHGAWNTTIANAWAVLAVEKFSKKFESNPVTGISSVKIADKIKKFDWQSEAEGFNGLIAWPSDRSDVIISHKGGGKPWATIQGLAAVSIKEPIASGYTIKKEITPLEQKKRGAWSRGDVARVKLEFNAQADMTWVVVSDPIPAGSTILGGGLGTDSRILTKGETATGWAWPVFTERTFTAYRAYYEYVAKGKWSLEYTLRLNTSGSFELPETRIEAIYAPEMFGELPNGKITITP